MDVECIIDFIRDIFKTQEFIPLHTPTFNGKEKKYLLETIDSTYVSSVGAFVNKFEADLANYCGAKYAIACVNGTSALHIALLVSGVVQNDEVLTQAITFIATGNAISYIGARPVFIDVDKDTMGMSPESLKSFLEAYAEQRADGFTYNKISGKRIKACVPMHTFGLPLRIDEILNICNAWNIVLIEDAAESIGSFFKGKHTGTYGKVGTFSFNGNKTITCGGGGALITDDEYVAKELKHLTTQAKVPHPWRFRHDAVGYNYRMPNLNAALVCAQLEELDGFIENKRELALSYRNFFKNADVQFVSEIKHAKSNYWLNAICFHDRSAQEDFLKVSNDRGVMTRPIWDLMNTMPMFSDCLTDGLENSIWLSDRIVNIPSSVRI
ncbi:aminotransferase, LLPSF_NHT_00031 family [Arachidicoccus rhizosphaerae]|uniref:GDP-perosamine synthase n=1 Tax=Arachidicoccus rhizosphaerae TaxID=551991 RepID=A0A1H4CPK6_9BACT|nr:LegC family aminotransferase [Arachidicoccus rhizosphaerae]SEA62250.1 aminotransferase, LLPSF_NHT_00031 family [Arachidicoccus rhizosphaerae]